MPAKIMTNHFDSKGGTQPIAQGDNPIGQLNNNYGVPYEAYGALAGKLAVTEAALASFFKILEEQQVPLHDLDSKLREIATQHKELLARLESVQSADPQVRALKEQAEQAIERGDYAQAEELLEDVANQHSIAAAETYAELASLQRLQWHYEKAAAYWQKAAVLLPEEEKEGRANCMGKAGYDLYNIAGYTEALLLLEQSLAIYREIGNRVGEGLTLNNISQIYYARGDDTTVLKYLKQSLSISQETGDKKGEGVTIGNIGKMYYALGDCATALKWLEQSLVISKEIGDKTMEGTTLSNIGLIYYKRGDYATAMNYQEQGLSISRKIGNRRDEAMTRCNIGRTYEKQGDLKQSEAYISRAVQLEEEIGHPDQEKDRKHLERVRDKLQGR
jgi:tetratricopeptide (TPR) repeat protein